MRCTFLMEVLLEDWAEKVQRWNDARALMRFWLVLETLSSQNTHSVYEHCTLVSGPGSVTLEQCSPKREKLYSNALSPRINDSVCLCAIYTLQPVMSHPFRHRYALNINHDSSRKVARTLSKISTKAFDIEM